MENKTKLSKRRLFFRIILIYTLLNILIFLTNPYASHWHYEDHTPQPIQVVQEKDSQLSAEQITKILDSIDKAYHAMEPSKTDLTIEQIKNTLAWIFFPSTIGLMMKSFVGYMGPANTAQQAFTISVKQRYNHLVQLGLSKGMQKKGFYFVEEASLQKVNGPAY